MGFVHVIFTFWNTIDTKDSILMFHVVSYISLNSSSFTSHLPSIASLHNFEGSIINSVYGVLGAAGSLVVAFGLSAAFGLSVAFGLSAVFGL